MMNASDMWLHTLEKLRPDAHKRTPYTQPLFQTSELLHVLSTCRWAQHFRWRSVAMVDFLPMTDRAAEAFADYVAMPPGKRNLRALADQYVRQKRYKTAATAFRQFSKWSSQFQWQARIAHAVTEGVTRKLEEAAELDADTFVETARRFNELIHSPGFFDANTLARIRESVRKPEAKATTVVDVKHSGTIKHAHHDMSAFTDEEIDTLAEIASRQKAEVAT